ncbi:MAG: hypothetical protein K5629_06615 [Eubacteriales bacterium]|nr:hypothetical protein [Eubacteriales bacterium]
MKILELLDNLQFQIENAPHVPFTDKVIMEKDDILDLIDELREAIPEEITEGLRIKEEEEKIREKARREAGSLIKEAREHKAQLIEESSVSVSAREEADQIIRDAQREVTRMRAKATDYITSLFDEAQNDLRETIALMEKNKKELAETKKTLTKGEEADKEE